MQHAVAAVAHEVADSWIELLHDTAQVLDGSGFMHLAAWADDAPQVGAAITRRGTVPACERIDDDD
ncbi:hypothetical protein MLAC_16470 [Mycobacterium lacus]|uniref:Uncharacterized protein n=1 Tax=Mycobacterium lacus TaxID=169765 RepID=A0A7I7NJ90_9MYCO|nr:hypothetical protein MLAC_16470 [Mycobacterium lacus]